MKGYSHKPLWILLSISSALYIILTGTLLCATSEISKEKPVVVYVTIGFLSLCFLLILIWSLIVMYRNSSEKCLNDVLFKKNNTNASLYVPALLLDSQNFWEKLRAFFLGRRFSTKSIKKIIFLVLAWNWESWSLRICCTMKILIVYSN